MKPAESFETPTSEPNGARGADPRSGGAPVHAPAQAPAGQRSEMFNRVDSFLRAAGLDPRLAELADEITERLQRGEEVDLDAYDARHPEWTATVRSLMPVLREMAELGRVLAAEADGPAQSGTGPGPAGGPRVLGDFRVLREVGRGGMGLVYEAEQLSLGRRVALKVLPLAAAMDPRALQRFQLEAQAAAWLQHPRIVPVYAVGSLGDVPYYAMQFIEGASLAELVNELRRLEGLETREAPISSRSGGVGALARGLLAGRFAPVEPEADGPPVDPSAATATDTRPPSGAVARGRDYARTVAQLGVQAAEALEYAHAQAILHRDVKPANLLLDRRGALWVTDFGLARLPGDGGGLTHTGDVVGTLRYMSPEQALARRALVDRRTDVYSLGATLYELLTLAPAVTGSDREELLRRMVEHDPVPVRRLNPAVPADLANVVTKALSKDPAGRYETAQHMADDLRRFLEGRPVAARRVGLAARTWRWCRRRPLPAGLIGGLALTLVAGFAGITWSWRDALRQRDLMVNVRRRTEESLARESRAYDALLRANRLERQAREQAQRRFALATDAIESYYTGASEEVLLKQPKMADLRRRLLETALFFYRRLQATIEEGPGDLKSRVELADVYRHVGQIAVEVGSREEGIEAYQRAAAILDEVVQASPDEPTPRRDQAVCLALAGKLLVYTAGREAEGIAALERAQALCEGLTAERPEDADSLLQAAIIAGDLGYERARMGQIAEGLAALERKREIAERLAAKHPSDPTHRTRLALTFCDLGKIQANAGHLDDALSSQFRASALFERLTAEEPAVALHRRRLGQVGTDVGRTLSDAGRPAEALPHLERARDLLERVAADMPAIDSFQRVVAEVHDVLGAVEVRLGRPDDALRTLARARSILTRLTEDRPDFVAYQADLAENLLWTGVASQDAGRDDEAARDLRAAREQLARIAPVGELLYDLARAEARLVPLSPQEERAAQTDRALDALRQAVAHGFRAIEAFRSDPCLDPIRSHPAFQLILLDLQFPDSPFSA